MNKEKCYKVEIKESLARIIDVEADSEEGAIRNVREQYNNQKIVLDSGDYIDVEINIYK